MKYIFLDVNGVLDTIESVNRDEDHQFEQSCLENLCQLVDNTGANIVVSSDWKLNPTYMEILLKELAKYGLHDKVLGTTTSVIVTKDTLTYVDRGEEILNFLEEHPCDNYVILDDIIWNLEKLQDHLVLTNPKYGLTEQDVVKATKILERQNIR